MVDRGVRFAYKIHRNLSAALMMMFSLQAPFH